MLTTAVSGRVLAVSAGGVGTLADGRRTMRTAFGKTPIHGPVELGRLGLPGDAHVYRHHGGPDMALCLYPAEHLPHWRATGLDLPDVAAFGENLTTLGLVETEVRIGDVFTLSTPGSPGAPGSADPTTGGAVVQVTQPRAPCRKIAVRHRRPKLDVALARAGHTGWLLRVLRPGTIAAGDVLTLVERHDHAVTVAEASRVLGVDRHDLAAVPAVLASPGLADAAAATLRRRLAAV